MAISLNAAWVCALETLAEENLVGPAHLAFAEIAKPMEVKDDIVVISVPSDYAKGVIETKVEPHLSDVLSQALARKIGLEIEVIPEDLEISDEDLPMETDNRQVVRSTSNPVTVKNKNLDLNPKYTFDTYVIGSSNRFACAAATAVAENPAKTYNPLFIYGGSGLGKTHLLHAIGNYAQNLYPDIKVRYVNSEQFTNDFINSVSTIKTRDSQNPTSEFQDRYRKVDILLIDDIQFLSGKERTIEEFFHTFNALHEQGKQVVITSDLPPKKLEGFEERLSSRFGAGLLTDIQPPDLETRIAILRNKLRSEKDSTTPDNEMEIPDEVLTYIASRFTVNIRELEGALTRVIAFSSLTQQAPTQSLAEKVLKDIISDPGDQEITATLIQAQTASYFNITVDQLCSASRSRQFSEARQIAMYLCRELTELSLPQVGKLFGGRDHTTVMHAAKKISQSMKNQPAIYDAVNELTNLIRQAARHS